MRQVIIKQAPHFFFYLVAEVSLESVDRFSRDAAVEAARVGGKLPPIRQRRPAVTVLHSHRRRCPL